jgi:predicted PurR-regulated permease PerM
MAQMSVDPAESRPAAVAPAEPAAEPAETAEETGGRPAPRWAVIGIFLILLVAGLAYARAFLMPTVLALLLALVFTPPRRAMERLGLGAPVAATTITLTLLALLVAAVVALAAPASEWVADARTIGHQIEWKLRDLRGVAAQVQDAARQLDEIAAAAEDEEVQRVVVEGPGVATSLAGWAPNAAAQAIFTLSLLFFLLASGDMFLEKVVHVMPTFRDKRRAILIARDIEAKLSQYLFTITAINAGLGAVSGFAMWIIGLPNPLLIGVVTFLLNYIPYLGALAGTALVAVVGLISLPTVWDAAAAAGVYLALASLEGQIVTPYFVGRNLRLNTVVVFLSVTFWAWLWSVVGMLVATPLLVMVRVFCERIPSLEAIGLFLSARGAEREDPDERA